MHDSRYVFDESSVLKYEKKCDCILSLFFNFLCLMNIFIFLWVTLSQSLFRFFSSLCRKGILRWKKSNKKTTSE